VFVHFFVHFVLACFI